jgi:RNAse (barnase) inhibitor barstar
MRLISFKLHDNYIFDLNFEDGAKKKVDLSNLIKSKVTLDELKSANIDKDWDCLEFKNGMVDIDPKTLYHFSMK